jgi:hypothetical protein
MTLTDWLPTAGTFVTGVVVAIVTAFLTVRLDSLTRLNLH